MRILLAFAAALAPLSAPPVTVAPAGGAPAVVRLDLSNFRTAPRQLTLVHGHAYILELVNLSGNGHDFTARALLGSSRIAGADAARLSAGTVDVPAHARLRIAIVPLKAGRFEFHCSHRLHAALGMKGRIDVL